MAPIVQKCASIRETCASWSEKNLYLYHSITYSNETIHFNFAYLFYGVMWR